MKRLGWTGTVELHRGRVDTSVQVTGGRIVFASSTNRDERLGELLLRRDKITLPQYYDASKAIRKGKRLGTVLVEQGALGLDHPAGHAEGSRLAGAVGPQQSDRSSAQLASQLS